VRGAVSGFCHGSAGRADTRHDHPGNSGEVRDGGWAVRLTAGDLETLGTFLFGPRWQSALARAIHYNPRQVRRSVAGETAVSIHATRLIEALALCRSLFRWQNEKDRLQLDRSWNCFNGLLYNCGLPQTKTVCQQIRGVPPRVSLHAPKRLRMNC
jgi:hypothetical protein